MFICNLCNYNTDDKSNFIRHQRNKKHIEKIGKNCEVDQLKARMKELETEYKHKLEIMEKEKEKLEAVIKVYEEKGPKTINNTQNNTINIGSINYVNEHFKDAPPLEKITDFIIKGIDTNDASQHDKFIDEVLYHHKNKILYQLIGDHVVSLYKKNDLSKQSFHTTDTSRLNYVVRVIENSVELVNDTEQENESDSEDSIDNRYNFINEETLDNDTRELIHIKKQYERLIKKVEKNKEMQLVKANEIKNNKKVWMTDKNGYKICKLLIDPTVKQLVSILKRRLKVKSKKKVDIETMNKELQYSEAISNILENIDTKKLKNDINKYIAPKFNLDKK
jgi:hypothetical protein